MTTDNDVCTIVITGIPVLDEHEMAIKELVREFDTVAEIRWYPAGEDDEYNFHIVDGVEYELDDVIRSNEGTLSIHVEVGPDQEEVQSIYHLAIDMVEWFEDDGVDVRIIENESTTDEDDTRQEVAELLERLHQLTGARAIVWWSAGDVGLDEDEAEEWLEENENHLRDSMIESGWKYIQDNV